jgi:alpha-mannosidase
LAKPLGIVNGILGREPTVFQLGMVDREFTLSEPLYRSEFEVPDTADLTLNFGIEDTLPALDLCMMHVWTGTGPDPGLTAGWRMPISPSFEIAEIRADHPYGVSRVATGSKGMKKYPSGDWMTSPQWFEHVEGAFTSFSFVDLIAENGSGLLVMHSGSQQFWLTDQGVAVQLSMIDPWDEAKATSGFHTDFRFYPHRPLTDSQRWRLAQEFRVPLRMVAASEGGDLPTTFSALSCDAPNVVPTAFYRETEDFSGKYLDDYAGKGIGYPFVVRVVEFDGIETEATLKVSGTVAKAYKTNFLGQIEEDVTDELKIHMRPYEIATVYLDIVEGRKQTRDLDAKREIWATVHRVDD